MERKRSFWTSLGSWYVLPVLISLNIQAEESLGMAMTFTIATAAREALSELIVDRLKKEKEEDDARTKAYEEVCTLYSQLSLTLQAEAAKTRGTPLTLDLYLSWREKFRKELAIKRSKEEEERVRTLPAKEREEHKRRIARASGRQLFETAKVSATSDEALIEDGDAVDVSQYSREERDRNRWAEEEKAAGVDLVDSDDE